MIKIKDKIFSLQIIITSIIPFFFLFSEISFAGTDIIPSAPPPPPPACVAPASMEKIYAKETSRRRDIFEQEELSKKCIILEEAHERVKAANQAIINLIKSTEESKKAFFTQQSTLIHHFKNKAQARLNLAFTCYQEKAKTNKEEDGWRKHLIFMKSCIFKQVPKDFKLPNFNATR